MILNSGVTDSLSNENIKRVRILNIIALLGAINCLIFIILDIAQGNISTAGGTIGGFLFIGITFFLQRKHFYKTARTLLILAGFAYFFVNANWLFTGKLSEFFYIMILMLTMIFFDKLWIHILATVACVTAFYIPNLYLEIYDKEVFGYANMGFLFISTFLILRHFKKLNTENENRLNDVNEVLAEKQEQLQKANHELKEISRLKSDFLIHFSHELKTPLTIIDGATHKLSDENKELSNIKNTLQQQSENILSLSDDLLSLAKVQSDSVDLNVKSHRLEEILMQAYSQFLDEFDNKSIVLDFENKLPQNLIVDTDKIYLLRIINNLLSNALKYSNADSTTTIKAELRSSKIIITIKDGGIGISSEDIHSIFKQFFRVNNQKVNGTGVGLAFVKAMIEKLGGEIKVESELLQGSTFTLEFPYENKPSSEITVEPSRFLKEARILIVEDKTEIQDYLIDVLKPYHTTVAKNGLEATHKLDKEVFDVIISDYMMPEMDGLQFIEWIRKKQITTPVIVLTAINKSDLRTEFLRLGVDEIMAKPFNPEELVVRVNRLLRAKPVKEDIKFSETQNEFEQKLKKLINDKIGKEEIKSIDLSEELNMSIRTFQRKVKELTGLTPNALIKEERLLKSQYLVENGLISSLKELSAQTGFKNTTYLQSIYEKRFGKKIQLK